MKTKIISFAFISLFFVNLIFAQDKTTINASTSEISDNLDLKAVASIFGDSENLKDFERRLNDPKLKISNFLIERGAQSIETIEKRRKSLIGKKTFQPLYTQEGKTNRFSIELSKDGKVQKKHLHIQVYGMKSKYELNAYIS